MTEAANYAQVVSIPLMIVVWLITADRFARFWKRWGKLTVFALVFVTFFAAARLNWLGSWNEQTTVPRWELASLILCAFAIPLVYRAFRQFRARAPRCSGEVDGVEWNWRFFYGKLLENTLVPICPNEACRCQLDHQPINFVGNSQSYRYVHHVRLICRRCGFSRDFE